MLAGRLPVPALVPQRSPWVSEGRCGGMTVPPT